MLLPLLLLLLQPSASWRTLADDQHQNGTKAAKTPGHTGLTRGQRKGFFIGDECDAECSETLSRTVCNRSTGRCQCDPRFPIVVEKIHCAAPLRLGERCFYDQSCKYVDRNSRCATLDDFTAECQCIPHYYPSIALDPLTKMSICVPELDGPLLKSDVPTLIGVGIGLSVFTGLTCLVLKLFSRARFAQARAYGDANLPPPSTPSNISFSQRCAHTRQMSIAGSELGSIPDSPRRLNMANGSYANNSRKASNNYGPRRFSSASFVSERSVPGIAKSARPESIRRKETATPTSTTAKAKLQERIELREIPNNKF